VGGSPRFEDGGFVGTMAVFADISERQQAEEALRESEARLRALIDHLPAEVWAMDNNLCFTIQNAASSRIVGNMVGKRIEDLPVPPDVKAGFLEQNRQVLDGNKTYNEYQIEVEGAQRHYESILAPVKVNGTILGLVGVALDVTERKQAEEEIRKYRDHLAELVDERTAELTIAKEQSEAANRAKNTFLTSISHELRTPLNAILGYAQILQRRPLDPDIIANLHTVQQSGKHLLTLINDILDVVEIEAGKIELLPAIIHLPSFLEHIASIIHAQATTKNLTFTFEATDTLPTWVKADETRLRQVLLNLLDNAVKFTEQGEVVLSVGAGEYGRDAPPHPHNYTLRFSLRDTGIGIPPDQLERVFQPFEQAEDVTQWAKGAGLGLPISRQLIRLMGGELHVESKEGQGSCFWFEVALPEMEVAAEDTQFMGGIITGYKGPRRVVLVADDVLSNRALLIDLLQPLGFDVVEAADGEQAIHLAQELRPDLILMDRWMPVLDGFEATQQIRQIPALKDIPIIAISASVSAEDRVQSQEAGIDAFLPKPVNCPSLAALLEKHLGLEWEYETEDEGGRVQAYPEQSRRDESQLLSPELVPPLKEELVILQDLALRGNMSGIRERSAHIETLGEQYVPFARKLAKLAKGFEERQLLILIKQYLEEAP
jgi:PAS domain S-box-containing protein